MENDLNLGELISLYYNAYLEQYGDPQMASVATAATINEMLEVIEEDTQPKRAPNAA